MAVTIFKNRFFRKLNLTVFIPLQIIQLLFETFFTTKTFVFSIRHLKWNTVFVRACVDSMKLYNFQHLYPMSLNITKKFPIKAGKLPNPRLLQRKLSYIQDLQFCYCNLRICAK